MRVKYAGWREHDFGTDVRQAALHAMTPAAYSYSGELERIQGHLELQANMIANILQAIADGAPSRELVQKALGSSYEVDP